jgi:hypothetical protein
MEYVFKHIVYIEEDVLIDLLNKIVERKWAFSDTSSIVKYINSQASYNILYQFKDFLTGDKILRVNGICKLGSKKKLCDICSIDEDCVVFKCHSAHMTCKNCACKLDICPYCRRNLWTFI